MLDGMTEPFYIPSKQIIVDNDEYKDDVDQLRPNSNSPLVVSDDVVTIRVWLMPEARVESASLVTAKNVKSYDVSYVRPGKDTREIPVGEVV